MHINMLTSSFKNEPYFDETSFLYSVPDKYFINNKILFMFKIYFNLTETSSCFR
jgi:hypothetical protein